MVVNAEDYIDFLKEEYPDIEEKILIKILDKGLKNMQHLIEADLDVRVGNNVNMRTYRMTIVKNMSSWDALMKRAKEKFYQLQRRRTK